MSWFLFWHRWKTQCMMFKKRQFEWFCKVRCFTFDRTRRFPLASSLCANTSWTFLCTGRTEIKMMKWWSSHLTLGTTTNKSKSDPLMPYFSLCSAIYSSILSSSTDHMKPLGSMTFVFSGTNFLCCWSLQADLTFSELKDIVSKMKHPIFEGEEKSHLLFLSDEN